MEKAAITTAKEIRRIIQNEPNHDKTAPYLDTARRLARETAENRLAAPLEYDEEEGVEEEEVMAAEEEIEIEVAADSACVDHVVGPGDIPGNIRVVKESGKTRNFVDAGNHTIKNYGKAEVELEQEDGRVIHNTFNVADVCRPLHAICKVTDNGSDVLFKRGCAYAVPEGVFDELLAKVTHRATYPRKGGLYVTRVKVRRPRAAKAKTAGFGRQGQGR